MVEELVAEPRHGASDQCPVRVAQVGAGCEEAVELATQLGLGAAAEPADQGGGVPAVRRGCRGVGHAIDDRRDMRRRLSIGRGLVLFARGRRPARRRRRRAAIDGRDDRSRAHGASIPAGARDPKRDPLQEGEPPELVMGACLDLADPFLADPQVHADLPERPLGHAPDAVAVHDDPALAPVQSPQEPLDRRSTPLRGFIRLVPIARGIERREGIPVRSERPGAAPFPPIALHELR